ncbi:MAG TPA: bifunctional metallophosphatase/5'-nucleotidase [Polyangiales bacterium]|nr:bifunctional metallophosphatase/5'-nucleotidase [Polyangiales bacterium]
MIRGLIIALSLASSAQAQEHIQLIGLNDFHGQLVAGRRIDGRPVGGASALAAYVQREASRAPTLIVHAGDWVGASPPESALLQDEPSIDFLGMLGSAECTRATPYHPKCNVVGTPGNHEFDEGVDELLRLLRGAKPWPGARVSYVSANVVDRAGKTILPPYVIKQVGHVRVGVIGATLREAPTMVVAAGVKRVRFLDEAQAINTQVRALKKRGVRVIVVTIHQGGPQAPYEGPTRADAAGPTEGIPPILHTLDDEVDVVISGHAHAFTNALMRNASGHEILVTQSLASGQALSVIDLTVREDVTEKTARVLLTYADAGVPTRADVDALVERAKAAVAPMTARVVGHSLLALESDLDPAGNSILGNLIADAQRAAVGAQLGLMNQGGVRTDLPAGDVHWGELFALQPFRNVVMALELTGAQIVRALEQQWLDPSRTHRLTVSGMRYTWNPAAAPGARIVEVEVGSQRLDPEARYRVAVNNFLAEGGSGFTMFREASKSEVGPVDLDALVAYITKHGFPRELEPRAFAF